MQVVRVLVCAAVALAACSPRVPPEPTAEPLVVAPEPPMAVRLRLVERTLPPHGADGHRTIWLLQGQGLADHWLLALDAGPATGTLRRVRGGRAVTGRLPRLHDLARRPDAEVAALVDATPDRALRPVPEALPSLADARLAARLLPPVDRRQAVARAEVERVRLGDGTLADVVPAGRLAVGDPGRLAPATGGPPRLAVVRGFPLHAVWAGGARPVGLADPPPLFDLPWASLLTAVRVGDAGAVGATFLLPGELPVQAVEHRRDGSVRTLEPTRATVLPTAPPAAVEAGPLLTLAITADVEGPLGGQVTVTATRPGPVHAGAAAPVDLTVTADGGPVGVTWDGPDRLLLRSGDGGVLGLAAGCAAATPRVDDPGPQPCAHRRLDAAPGAPSSWPLRLHTDTPRGRTAPGRYAATVPLGGRGGGPSRLRLWVEVRPAPPRLPPAVPAVLALPPAGRVAADVLADGTPVFVHVDGDRRVVVTDARSPHDPGPVSTLLDACTTAGGVLGALVDPVYGSRFAPDGSYRFGPAPTGVPGYAATARDGRALVTGLVPPAGRWWSPPPPLDAAGRACLDPTVHPASPLGAGPGTRVVHHRPDDGSWPRAKAEELAGDLPWTLVEDAAIAWPGAGPARLCTAPQRHRCPDRAPVVPSGALRYAGPGAAYTVRGPLLVRLLDGTVTDVLAFPRSGDRPMGTPVAPSTAVG